MAKEAGTTSMKHSSTTDILGSSSTIQKGFNLETRKRLLRSSHSSRKGRIRHPQKRDSTPSGIISRAQAIELSKLLTDRMQDMR